MQNPDETRINRLVWCERERDDVVDVWTVRVPAAEVVGDGSAAVGARQISRAGRGHDTPTNPLPRRRMTRVSREMSVSSLVYPHDPPSRTHR